jgi:hypothetical protein
MKRKKTAHISAMIHEGDFSLIYECVGEFSCEFVLCELMPPSLESNCFFLDHGGCRCPAAQKASIKALLAKLRSASKELEENEE